MEVKVFLRNLRIAPRKSKEVVDLIRNKSVADAKAQLEFTVKRASDPILRLLNSAVASAVNDFHLDESNLKITKIWVDEGPKLKRSFPMSRGRAYPIMKRTSHITLAVGEMESKKPASLTGKAEKEVKKAEVKKVTKSKTKKVKK
jgi:large subunit ribosomal protein L22